MSNHGFVVMSDKKDFKDFDGYCSECERKLPVGVTKMWNAFSKRIWCKECTDAKVAKAAGRVKVTTETEIIKRLTMIERLLCVLVDEYELDEDLREFVNKTNGVLDFEPKQAEQKDKQLEKVITSHVDNKPGRHMLLPIDHEYHLDSQLDKGAKAHHFNNCTAEYIANVLGA